MKIIKKPSFRGAVFLLLLKIPANVFQKKLLIKQLLHLILNRDKLLFVALRKPGTADDAKQKNI
ncbi:hypothetical protein AAV35_013320 [Salimicrobium jeotgali]|uniref:Uncharacterized protein n=1 Tax=Salimicrobium jeotgali TaxID=1230341 RepID=K2G9E6_9BACI|nr:hypothetical protein AAV35_013320 [Salimicrobium jeotgali]EKE31007.1 hypothetical protein MJ3_10836 [Salimicrobium jeotgali]